MRRAGILSLYLGLLMASTSAESPRNDRPAEKPIRFRHVTVDRKAREVVLDTTVVRASYHLEFLLCRSGTKEYESVLATQALPSDLHAALLLLGLRSGIPGGYVGDEYVPPRGATLDIELRWKDKAGNEHTAQAGDWLKLTGQGGEGRKPDGWVFIGSEVLPDGRYLADETGGVIAVANLGSAVIDVPMQSTRTMELREYAVNTDALPPVGTDVRMVLRPRPGQDRARYARALLEIDHHGAMRIDNRPVTPRQLTAWAEHYTDRHPRGMVVIRSSAHAPAGLAMWAQTLLKLGGVFAFDHRTTSADVQLLPRTKAQLAESLARWDARFAEPHEELEPPSDRAERTLRAIERRRGELKRLDELWAEYRNELRRRIDASEQADPAAENPAEDTPARPVTTEP